MALNIPLTDGYRILSDSQQFVLAREDGKRLVNEAYCQSIEHAVKVFLDKRIRAFDSKSIHELLLSIKSLQTRLNKALQPLKLEVTTK